MHGMQVTSGCPVPSAGSCSAPLFQDAVRQGCLGRENCTISCRGRVPPVDPKGICTAGGVPTTIPDPCYGIPKQVAVAVACGTTTTTWGQTAAKHNLDDGRQGAPAPASILAPGPVPAGCHCVAAALNITLGVPGKFCGSLSNATATFAAAVVCVPAGIPARPPRSPALAPHTLLLQFMAAPVAGMDNLQPHFSWVPAAATGRASPADVQSACRVTIRAVGSGAAVWTSGIVNSSVPALDPATPLPLASDTAYVWGVEVWGAGARALPVASAPAAFTTGLLRQEDWGGAGWVGGGTLLRTEFIVPAGGPASRISVFVSACQYASPGCSCPWRQARRLCPCVCLCVRCMRVRGHSCAIA